MESEGVWVKDNTSERYSRNSTDKFWKLIGCTKGWKAGAICIAREGRVKEGSPFLVW